MNLHEIANVHYERSRRWWDVDPLVVMEDLQAADVILKKDCEEASVRMLGCSNGDLGLRTWRVVVKQYHLTSVALNINQVARV